MRVTLASQKMSMHRRTALLLIVAALVVTGCAKHKRVAVAKPARIGSTETGIASWYGYPYHGRRAANGEVYDMEAFTAAHRTLPFETWVRVRNLSNSRTVDVRIQDRGPFIDGRVIDLSRAAAREIELLGPGVTKVKLTVIKPPKHPPQRTSVIVPSQPQPPPQQQPPAPVRAAAPPPPLLPEAVNDVIKEDAELFAVQVGAFQDKSRAEALRDRMQQQFAVPSRIVPRQGATLVWRVLVGEEDTSEKADALAGKLRSAGQQTFVVRLDRP
jgi:rare lipoprotein A